MDNKAQQSISTPQAASSVQSPEQIQIEKPLGALLVSLALVLICLGAISAFSASLWFLATYSYTASSGFYITNLSAITFAVFAIIAGTNIFLRKKKANIFIFISVGIVFVMPFLTEGTFKMSVLSLIPPIISALVLVYVVMSKRIKEVLVK